MIIVEEVVTPEPPLLPEPPTPPYVDPRLRLAVVLHGTDGSFWDMYDGNVRILSGAAGFGTPAPTHRYREAPFVDGSTWYGSRTGAKKFVMPVQVRADGSMQWRDIDQAFFKAIDSDQIARLQVITPDGGSRWLGLRYADGGDPDIDVDPLLLRHLTYALSFDVEDPYWQGEPIGTRYTYAEPAPLFPGPPFNINPATLLQDATITNPGDVPAAPRWRAMAPFTSFTVGIPGATTRWVGNKTSGYIDIDLDPRRLTVVDETGADAWAGLAEDDFADIPDGADIPLALDIQGAQAGTALQLQFTPRHRRAW